MSTFKEFTLLLERKTVKRDRKPVFFTFIRANPPTKGHLKLIDKVIALAKSDDHYIFTSQTQDPKRNPLEWAEKVRFMKLLFPNANVSDEISIKTPFNAIDYFDRLGYTDMILVVGSDRLKDFGNMKKYTVDSGMFNSLKIVSAGERDPDDEGISGMSATKARQAASLNSIAKFRVATGWGGDISKELMAAVRKGLGIE